jgi:hypothetical protein
MKNSVGICAEGPANFWRGNPAWVADFIWEGNSKSGVSLLTEGPTSEIEILHQVQGEHFIARVAALIFLLQIARAQD